VAAPQRTASEEAAKAYDKLHEGVPGHLVEALKHWLLKSTGIPTWDETRKDRKGDERRARALLRDFEVKSGWRVAPDQHPVSTVEALFKEPNGNADLLLDMLDFVAHVTVDNASSLKRILDEGRSAWTVDTDAKLLVRRVPGAEVAFAAIKGTPGTAAAILQNAWTKVYGLYPDPTAAYDEAIRAVEAAFCSAVLPKKDLSTLGHVTSALKDDPSKLRHVWPASDEGGRSAAELTRSLMELLMRQQGWRHGSEGSKDPNAPKSASPEQAKAAVHLALLLISWKVSGSVIPAPKL